MRISRHLRTPRATLALAVSTAALLGGCEGAESLLPGPADQESQLDALNTSRSINRGTRRLFETPRGEVTEICFEAPRFPGAKYGKKDQARDAELCSYDFYKVPGDDRSGIATHVCPKLNSTNPGIDLHKFKFDPANSMAENEKIKASFEKRYCGRKGNRGRRPAKKLAKFKQTITCSYTGSIVSAYHLSRMLGDILNIPNVVLRTMDRKEHWRYVKMGASGNPERTNAKFWKSYKKALGRDTPGSSMTSRQNLLLTEDGLQIFGGMQRNPRGEFHYQPKSGVDTNVRPLGRALSKASGRSFTWDNVNIGARRLASRPHKLLRSSAKITDSSMKMSDIKDKDLNLIHRVKVLKDIADMYIFDHILSMKDRPGNIHMIPRYYFKAEEGDGSFLFDDKKVRFDEKKKILVDKEDRLFDPNKEYGKGQWVVIPRVILKDNDCGARPNPYTAKNKVFDSMRHVGLTTYKRLRWLATQPDAVADYFTRIASYDTPYKSSGTVNKTIKKGIVDVAKKLYKRCKEGKLFLDLMKTKTSADLEAIRSYRHSPELCEQIYSPGEES